MSLHPTLNQYFNSKKAPLHTYFSKQRLILLSLYNSCTNHQTQISSIDAYHKAVCPTEVKTGPSSPINHHLFLHYYSQGLKIYLLMLLTSSVTTSVPTIQDSSPAFTTNTSVHKLQSPCMSMYENSTSINFSSCN